jgi:hypothetical protein
MPPSIIPKPRSQYFHLPPSRSVILRAQYTLTFTKTSTGNSTRTSNNGGISCGSDCSETYSSGTIVTLTATPSAGSVFSGWSGDCNGTNSTTQLTMNADKTCTARFTLSTTPLKLLQPNGGERWKAGNRYDLKWQSPTNAYNFILQYSTDNKTTWRNIKTVLANNTCNNTGSYLDCKTGWQIPAQDGRKPQSFVRVIARNASNQTIGQDVSDNAFAIEVLRVTSPNGNETLRVGQTYTITWETYALSKPVLMVILQYSTDGGSSWKPIKTFLRIDPKRYSWRVPNDPSPNCKVRVVLKDFLGKVVAVGESDSPFTITRP